MVKSMSLRSTVKQSLLAQLVVRDFRSRYSGTVFGVVWALLQPLAMMTVLYVVFNYGLRAGGASDPLFVPWLFIGMVAWNFFSDSLGSMTGAFHEYAFLVKKVRFPLHMIPIVKLMTAMMMHLVFLAIVFGITLSYGVSFSLCWIQVPFLALILAGMSFGLGLITSALNVFARDVAQAVGVVLQFAFWATPVVWSAERIPERFRWMLDLNPVYGVLTGYRVALLESKWFFVEQWGLTLQLIVSTVVFLVVGFYTHNRLRRHFADVL